MQKKRKYRNKWYRAYTLARNPCIVLERMQKELKEKQASHDIEVSLGSYIQSGNMASSFIKLYS